MLMTKKELSTEIKLSIATIDRLMTKGLPFIKLERAVRFDKTEVEEWLKAGVTNEHSRIYRANHS